MQKPVLFVGSSSEAKHLINGLTLNLKNENVRVRNWGTSRWPLSRSTLDGLDKKFEEADFATFILSPDDVAIIRGKEEKVARDNVLFELGMSFGYLGRDRTFIIASKEAMHNVSDLHGITAIRYEDEQDDQDTMSTPAVELLAAIRERGPRERADTDGARRRGSTDRIEMVADGAIEVFESRDEYFGNLAQAVLNGKKVPAKFQFAAADGGRRWLELCHSESYGYFKRAKTLLKDNIKRLAENVCAAADTAAVDLISLGSGDGRKDDIILQELAKKLSENERLYYYPIDISDILLVEAIRYVSRHGLGREHYGCKAVLGDFTNLPMIRELIDYRPNANLFSALGNVIGSFDESEIFASIAGAMRKGDLVLIEANIGEPGDSIAMLEDDAASQWDLSTLAALDLSADLFDLKPEEKKRQSVVPGTRTLVSYAVPRERPSSKYTLSGMHHYDFEKLKAHVASDLRVTLVDEIAGDGVCLLLGQRRD